MNPATTSSMLVLVFSLVVIAAGAESLGKSSYNLSLIEKPDKDLVPIVETTTMELKDIGEVIAGWKLGPVTTCAPCKCYERTDTTKSPMEVPCCYEIRCFTPPGVLEARNKKVWDGVWQDPRDVVISSLVYLGDCGSLVDIEPVSRRDTDGVDEVQENGQNGDPVPDYQGDTIDADGHVDDVVHQEQEVPPQVPVDLPRRSDRERRPSTRYSPSQYVFLTDGGEPESYEEAMESEQKRQWLEAMQD
nr:hypothetical retrotransposon [Ipomoea trifida]